jgi:hypothetical protein
MLVNEAKEKAGQVKREKKGTLKEEKKKHMHNSDLQQCEGTKDGRSERWAPGPSAELVAAASRCLLHLPQWADQLRSVDASRYTETSKAPARSMGLAACP